MPARWVEGSTAYSRVLAAALIRSSSSSRHAATVAWGFTLPMPTLLIRVRQHRATNPGLGRVLPLHTPLQLAPQLQNPSPTTTSLHPHTPPSRLPPLAVSASPTPWVCWPPPKTPLTRPALPITSVPHPLQTSETSSKPCSSPRLTCSPVHPLPPFLPPPSQQPTPPAGHCARHPHCGAGGHPG